jgi:hypothetical protein
VADEAAALDTPTDAELAEYLAANDDAFVLEGHMICAPADEAAGCIWAQRCECPDRRASGQGSGQHCEGMAHQQRHPLQECPD